MSQPLRTFAPVFESQEIKNAMLSFETKWLSRHDPPEQSQLYHYTTIVGLQGIIKDRAIWFGHVTSLNDRLEMQYGQDLIANVIREHIEKEKRQDIRNFLQNLLTNVQVFGKAMHEMFVACFCQSGNLLSQWRGYANSGGGYCLGFEILPRTRITYDIKHIADGTPPLLRKIIYNENEQGNLIKEYIDKICEAAKKALDVEFKDRITDPPSFASTVIGFQAASILLDMVISFKHPAFEQEEEWRMVRVMLDNQQPEYLQFRQSPGGLVPYRPTYIYNIDDKADSIFPLRTIGFGPMLEPVRTRSAIKLLMQNIASDQHPIKVLPSNVNIKESGYSLRN